MMLPHGTLKSGVIEANVLYHSLSWTNNELKKIVNEMPNDARKLKSVSRTHEEWS
jgi:hypothetical protein